MRGPSFRSLVARPNLPRLRGYKPWLAAAWVVLAATACGGGDGDAESARTVTGPRFTFSAPADWDVEVGGRSATASPDEGASELVSVRVFRLARRFRPELWARVVPELDRVAAELAERLGGRIEARATVVVAARRARSYDIRYSAEGEELLERTAFVLQGRREFQLVCRFPASDGGEGRRACATLFSTLTLRPE